MQLDKDKTGEHIELKGATSGSSGAQVYPFPGAVAGSTGAHRTTTYTPAENIVAISTHLCRSHRASTSVLDQDRLNATNRAKEEERLRDAFYLITDVCDESISKVERSNCFDDWKDQLTILSRKTVSLSTKHRKILGSMIAATRGKDVADFTLESLQALKEAAFVLRQFNITKTDARRNIEALSGHNLKLTINLAPDGLPEKHIENLEQMMKSLIQKESDNV
jgi:uncharacterized protein (DUF1778 family)